MRWAGAARLLDFSGPSVPRTPSPDPRSSSVVKLRLKRFGRRNRPFYRLNAIDQRTNRDGMPIEELGSYDPRADDDKKATGFKVERIRYWLSVGAQPSPTVRGLLRTVGIDPTPGKQIEQ